MALNDKQGMFCREYLIDLNATQAAIRAGYSDETENRIASKLLSKVDIQNRIAELKAQRNEQVNIDAAYPNTVASANGIDLIHDYNALTAKRYGSLSIDNAAYLMSSQIWTDAMITPTSADLSAQSKGVIAPSLSSDGLHMNSPIEQLVIDKLIKPKMQELWFS